MFLQAEYYNKLICGGKKCVEMDKSIGISLIESLHRKQFQGNFVFYKRR